MELNATQIESYRNAGYLLLPGVFTEDEIATIKAEGEALAEQDGPQIVREKESGAIRAVHGCHLYSALFKRLVTLPRMLGPAQEILGGEAYVYQLKINFKRAFGGDIWQWHQDFIFWNKEDGMRVPECANFVLFLDAVTEFNGPLMIIPGSHRRNMIDVGPAASGATDWRKSFSADLKYALDGDALAPLVQQAGIVAPKGQAGSMLIFHPNLVHGSAPNMSPFNRSLLIVTYNSTANIPPPNQKPRPEFIVSRDCAPLRLAEDAGI